MQIKRAFCGSAVAVALLAMATSAIAYRRPSNGVPGHIPNYQYTNVAPLPGAGVAIDSQGKLNGEGAMQVNIPVAYTPGWGYVSLTDFEGEHPIKTADTFDNGSTIVGAGFFSKHRMFLSAMQVSGVWHEAKAVSGQVSLFDETAKLPALSVGVQDLLGKEPNGHSEYFVLTKSFALNGQKLYGTAGYGSGRFLDKPFAGISMPISGRFNFVSEWDGFQLNNGIGWRPDGKDGKFTFYAGSNGHVGLLVGGGYALNFAK